MFLMYAVHQFCLHLFVSVHPLSVIQGIDNYDYVQVRSWNIRTLLIYLINSFSAT